jgi:hypothetical protein
MSQSPSCRLDSEVVAVAIAGLSVGLLLSGCAAGKHTVVASTGTYLGVDVSPDSATHEPHIKVGYGRTELALVPTNRDDDKKPGSRIGEAVRHDGCEQCRSGAKKCDACGKDAAEVVKAMQASSVTCDTAGKTKFAQEGITDGGAQDSAEVLMEIKAEGSGGMGIAWQGGIYQRLAVGKIAVQQPGATALMTKGLNAENVDAAVRLQAVAASVPETPSDVRQARAELADAFITGYSNAKDDKEKTLVEEDFNGAAKIAGYDDWAAFIRNTPRIPNMEEVQYARKYLVERKKYQLK